jgi:hypothetical protein
MPGDAFDDDEPEAPAPVAPPAKPEIPSPPWAGKARRKSDAKKAAVATAKAATRITEEPRAAPPELVALGEPPSDPLEVQAYLLKALAISARECMTDERMTPSARRKELRTIAGAATKLVPKSRIFEAEQTIKSDRAALEQRKRTGAKLEPVPAKKP